MRLRDWIPFWHQTDGLWILYIWWYLHDNFCHTHTNIHWSIRSLILIHIPCNDTGNQKQQISRNKRLCFFFSRHILWLIVYLVDIILQIVINRWKFVCVCVCLLFMLLLFLFPSLFPNYVLGISNCDEGLNDNMDVSKCIRLELCKFDGHCAECTLYIDIHILKSFRQIIQSFFFSSGG